ncbi:MAG TPA: pyridoxal 5'-phosphate synthase glutaminase subunit PdxT [Chthonomonadales bacterium]|nr:pyridoxal 5'-phosphate synthase glutaminase subunit PdxT [Chthonomonadales bacterium]
MTAGEAATRDPLVRVGVLGLQGDVEPHRAALHSLPGVDAPIVRSRGELEAVDGLVIPGGESTTIGKLLDRMGLLEPLVDLAARGLPVYGTCAGLIVLARDIEGSEQHRLGVMDVTVARNAFGRQVESFEADIDMPALGGEPVRGVFIRAPYVRRCGPGVEVLARFRDRVVAVRQGHLLGTAFHPELTADRRVHAAFVETVRRRALRKRPAASGTAAGGPGVAQPSGASIG